MTLLRNVAGVPVWILSVDATPVNPVPSPVKDAAVTIPEKVAFPLAAIVAAVPTFTCCNVGPVNLQCCEVYNPSPTNPAVTIPENVPALPLDILAVTLNYLFTTLICRLLLIRECCN